MIVKRKKRTGAIAIIVIAIILAAGFLGLRALNNASSSVLPADAYKEASAERGTITTTLTASSNLAESEAFVEIPYGVTVTEVYVAEGDYVAKGQRIAAVSASSLASELKNARKKLEDIDGQIERDGSGAGIAEVRGNMAETVAALEALETLDTKELYSGASGIVKTVNIKKGEALSRTPSSALPQTPDLSGLYASQIPDLSGLSELSDALSSGGLSAANIDWAQVFGSMSEAERAALIESIIGAVPPQATVAAVPNLTGLTSTQAKALLEALRLALGTVTEGQTGQDGQTAPETTAEGVIIAQSYAPGSMVNVGTAVDVTAYKKPEQTPVPNPSVPPEPAEQSGEILRFAQNDTGRLSVTSKQGGRPYGLLSPEEARTPSAVRVMMGYSIPQDMLDSVTGGNGGASETQAVSSAPTGAAVVIVPVETYTVNVMIDELDILSVREGQEATVEFDALADRSFDAVVTEVGTNSAGAGTVQYPVSLILPRESEMRVGMNVTVIIRTSEKQGVLTLPAVAVYEDGQGAFVYTKTDELGALAAPVHIVTGVSDGETVEIASGLSEGTTVYYEEIIDEPRGGMMMF